MKRLCFRLERCYWRVWLAVTLCIPMAVPAADVATDVAFGPSPVPGYLGKVLQPLSAGDPLLPGAFQLKAQLGLKQVPAMELDSSAPLEPEAATSRAAAPEHTVRLNASAGTDLSAYDELWIDHAALGQCSAQLTLQTDEGLREGRPSSTTIIGMEEGRSVLLSEQPARMPWVAKDMFYLLARQWGSRDDGKWRYAQDGDATVLQRRLQVSLDRAQTIEMEFPAGARLNGVNLFISVGHHHRPSRLLTSGDFTSEVQDDGQRTRLRIRLDRVLAEYRQRGQIVSLAELLVFYRGARERTVVEQPLRRLTIYSLAGTGRAPDGGRVLQVPMTTAPLTTTVWRTKLDLRDVTGRWVARMPLRSAGWQVSGAPGCKTDLVSARLVKLRRSSTPAFLDEAASRIRSLGGPFLVRPEDHDGVEWLDFAAQLPLAEARVHARLPRGQGGDVEFPGWGLRMASSGGTVEERGVAEGMLLPSGAMVDMDWQVDFRVRPGQRLYVGIQTTGRRQPEVEVRAVTDDGRDYRFRAMPSQPVLLDRRIPEGARVRSLSLRFDALEVAASWTVKDVSVFRPYRLDAAQAATEPRFGWGVVPLLPRADATDLGDAWRSDGVRLTGILRARPEAAGATMLRWSTPVGLPARDLLELRLEYDVRGAEMDSCWLQAEILGSDGHRLERRLCPRDGHVREGMAAELRERFGENERVTEIRWTAALYMDRPVHLSFLAEAGVGARPSVMDSLSRGTGLLVEGSLRMPEALPGSLRDALVQGRRRVWLDYGVLEVGQKQEMTPVLLQDDGLFELRHVTLVSNQDEKSEAVVEWRDMLRPPKPPPGMGKLKKLVLAFAAGAGAWLAWRLLSPHWRNGRIRLRALALQGRLAAETAWGLGEHVAAGVGRHRRVFHLASIVAALPWFGWAGRGDEGAPWLLGAGVALWMTSALHLWRGLPAWGRFFAVYLWPCMWFAWLAWALGAYPAPSSRLSSLAVVVGCLWPVASMLHLSLLWMRRVAGLWLCLMLLLGVTSYGFGFMRTADWGENVFITLGGLWMIAAWWFATVSARDTLVRCQPRLARWIYGERGGPFLVGSLLALAASVALLMLGMSQIAAHVVTLCFYQLCIGVALQASVHWWRRSS